MTAGDRRQAYLRNWDVTVRDGGEGERIGEDWELGVPLQDGPSGLCFWHQSSCRAGSATSITSTSVNFPTL